MAKKSETVGSEHGAASNAAVVRSLSAATVVMRMTGCGVDAAKRKADKMSAAEATELVNAYDANKSARAVLARISDRMADGALRSSSQSLVDSDQQETA